MWPSPVLTRWKSFCIEKDVRSIKKFLQVFTNFLQDGRRARNVAESALWTVSPTVNTKWDSSKPIKTDSYADVAKGGHQNQGNSGKKRLLESGSSSAGTGSGTPSSVPMCNVCNRKKYPGNDCPFSSWHPYANKDTRIPFPDSSKGKSLR